MFDWIPRPDGDNGFGMCGDQEAGDGAGSIGFMYHFIDAMVDKNILWLKLLVNVDHNSGRLALLEHARKKGRMVIVRPFRQPLHPTGYDLYDDFIRAVIDHGGNYIEVGNEPNLGKECTKPYPNYKYNGTTGHEAFVNLLYDQWLRLADRIRRLGGIPLFPAMSPTAYTSSNVYYHHRLYNEILGLGKLRGNLEWAFEGTGIAVHNRPCDGQPLDKVDRCAFRDYEWIEATFQKALGRPIPLFGTESGYEDGMVGDYIKHQLGNLYPNNEDYLHWHKVLNHEIFNRFNPSHPKAWEDYLICQCMWLGADNGWYASGYARNARTGGGPTWTWRDMHELPYFVRGETEPDPGPVDPDPVDPDPIPEPEPPDPPPPPPPPTDIVGKELLDNYNLTIEPCEMPGYKIVKLEERCEAANCDVKVLDKDGKPFSAMAVRWGWPGTQVIQYTDPHGRAGFAMAHSAYYSPVHGQSGPHWTAASIGRNSEVLRGIGMVAGTVHCTVNPTFRYFLEAEPPPPPPPPPPSTEFTIFDACERWGLNLIDKRVTCARHAHLDRIVTRKPRGWNGIVIHHTASNYSGQTPESIAIDHTKSEDHDGRGFASIGYQFLVGFDAEPYFTGPVSWASDHCEGMEMETVGISVMGDFTTKEPTDAQVETVRRLILALQDWLGRGKPKRCYVLPHNYVWPLNECPGALKDMLVWEGEWP